MKLKLFISLTIFLFIGLQQGKAQSTVKLSGSVVDTMRKEKVQYASVCAVRLKDSSLIAYTRTNEQGKYNLQVPVNTHYNIIIAHPSFATYQEDVKVKEAATEMGATSMSTRTKMLEAIIVRQKGSIRIKGDTTVYLADSFKVDANASVEDLLKILPGMMVDKDGNIITQGEQVQKVLVDGEEFFGDDPTVATKNLQAKTIEKVEVFDNKSEQAKFTGFDDGVREKTINLKMKKDMNKGVFGKVQAGSNGAQIWDNSAMVSSFANKRKVSVYAINSSRGNAGLNWNDRERFGGSGGDMMEVSYGSDGSRTMTMTSNEGGDDNFSFNGAGIPSANNIGVHYSNKWLENKHHLNVNANARETFINKIETNKQTNYIGANTIYTDAGGSSFTNRKNISASTRYEITIDTTSSFTTYIDAYATNTIDKTNTTSKNSRNGNAVSNSSRNNTNDSWVQNLSLNNSYKKRLKKMGRTISFTNRLGWKDTKSNGNLLGNNQYGTKLELLDQQRKNNTLNLNASLRSIYTEPLIQNKLLAEFSHEIGYNNNDQKKFTYIKNSGNTEYNQQIDSLSNTFEANTVSNTVGGKLLYKKDKWSVNGGTDVRYTNFTQNDVVRNKNYNYNRVNFLPNLNLNYKVSSQSSLRFSYYGFTNQPTVTQLQNVINNNDPLNIYIGNPNLKQEFKQNFRLNYNNYKTFEDQSFSASISFGNVFNNIASTQLLDTNLGRTINTYTNINGRYNANSYINFSRRIAGSAFTFNAAFRPSFIHQPNYVNGLYNLGNSLNTGGDVGLRFSKSKKAMIYAEVEISRNMYDNKILKQSNNYLDVTNSIDADVYITKRCIFSTDVAYNWQQQNKAFAQNFNRVLWNAEIGYRFLKQKNLETKLIVRDILNQNNGYTRTATNNYISEKTNNSLQRYALLSVIYNFSVGPINKLPTDDDDF